MSAKKSTDRRTIRSAAFCALLLAPEVAGCSPGAKDPGSAGQVSSNPIGTSSASPSPSTLTTTASVFQQNPVDSAFAKKVGALCDEWNSFASNHQYPGVANPQAITREELSKIGAWMDSLPINHELVTKATGLGTPAEGASAWAHVLEGFTEYQKAVTAAANAAKVGELQAWQTAEKSWSAARDKVREDLLQAGIGAKSSCSLPFIRPAGHNES